MKRDMDLCRDILLEFESSERGNVHPTDIAIRGATQQVIREHVQILADDGLLKAVRTSYTDLHDYRLSGKGHDFLANTRVPERWERIKALAAEVAGGMDVAIKVAAQMALERAKERMKTIKFAAK